MDLITGDKFKTVADFLYAPEKKHSGAYDNLQNTLDLSKLGNINIVYTHTFYVKQLFQLIASLSQKFIVITHNADTNINESFKMPDNILKWYSQNVGIIDPRITSIPIGLENDRWFPELKKKQKMINLLRQPKRYRNLVYMNYNINTNSSKRLSPYMLLENKSWVTTEMGVNGEGFDQYLYGVYNHRFVICPEGNGMDTHRTWESLYMNSIPIEKKNINNQFYTDLPICFVNDWDEIKEEFLQEELVRINTTEWNLDKLRFKYWKDKIKNNL